ncbi:D-Ala-D-Ala carboxypeptidase family metallohydrolase [Candidatus Pelagibacter ubique]|nr:D-Ala-D-Ala carboxypeptidase family metallohydrolase [Candidatus Pelagibacter ubique]
MSTYIREQSDWKEKWKNFNLDEFRCKCGCGHVSIHSDLLDLLQTARNNIGRIGITSAFRCNEHNDKVSSTGLSGPHTTSKAVDIHVSNSQHRKLLIDYFTNKVTGLGIAKTFIHIDILTSDEVPHRPNCWLY